MSLNLNEKKINLSIKTKNLLGKRGSFDEHPKMFSETSSVSSMNNSILDFDKRKLPKHLQGIGKSMMDTPGKISKFNFIKYNNNFIDQIKKKIDKIMEICNILQHCGVPDIYFMRKEDIKKFIFEEDNPVKELNTSATTISFNKPSKNPKIH